MRLGIVMPVYLQQEALLDLTCQAVGALATAAEATLYVVCTRLHVCGPEELRRRLQGHATLPVRGCCTSPSWSGAWRGPGTTGSPRPSGTARGSCASPPTTSLPRRSASTG